MPLEANQQQRLNDLLKSNQIDQQKYQFITDMMNILPTVDHHGNFDHGRLEDTGLLLMAAIRDKKKNKYDVNPTILGQYQFKDYLTTLQQSIEFPVEEYFIIAGGHWVAGKILVEDPSQPAKILFVDSIGRDLDHSERNLLPFIICANKVFTNRELYVNARQRQFSLAGCLVFAIDDVRHMVTATKYLPNKENLFDYISKNIVSQEGNQQNAIHHVKLPLSLMRGTHSVVLLKDKDIPEGGTTPSYISEYSELERKVSLGKGKPTADQLAQKFKDAGDKFTDARGETTIKNMYLADKLRGMNTTTFDYLLKTDETIVRQSMQDLTLEGFQNRMSKLTEKKLQKEQQTTTSLQKSGMGTNGI